MLADDKLNKLYNEFSEFKGEISTGMENLCDKLDKQEKARNENSKAHWDKVNKLHDDIHREETARIQADNEIKTDLAKTKVRVGGVVSILTVGLTLLVHYIKGLFSNGGSN